MLIKHFSNIGSVNKYVNVFSYHYYFLSLLIRLPRTRFGDCPMQKLKFPWEKHFHRHRVNGSDGELCIRKVVCDWGELDEVVEGPVVDEEDIVRKHIIRLILLS